MLTQPPQQAKAHISKTVIARAGASTVRPLSAADLAKVALLFRQKFRPRASAPLAEIEVLFQGRVLRRSGLRPGMPIACVRRRGRRSLRLFGISFAANGSSGEAGSRHACLRAHGADLASIHGRLRVCLKPS